MNTSGHLWAIGYGDTRRAAEVRDEIVKLGWVKHDLILEDVAVVVRHADGSFKVDRGPVPSAANVVGLTLVGVLAGLVLGEPIIGAAVGTALGLGGAAVSATVGIGDDFVREVEGLMKPGSSVLFVLDSEGDMDVILHGIRGLGGTVLKTNVDVERARLIQSTLAAAPPPGAGERK